MPDSTIPPPPPPPGFELAYDCPACLGARLEKWHPVPDHALVLDRCGRCGGIWFDQDEVQTLQRLRPHDAWRKIVIEGRGRDHMQCHACHGAMPTHAETCSACEWKRALDCPSCGRLLASRANRGIEVDACDHCHGAWFDHPALKNIWALPMTALAAAAITTQAASAQQGTLAQAGDAASTALDAAASVAEYMPLDVAGAALEGGVRLAGSAINTVVTHGPGVAEAALEATGNIAGAVFEAIAGILGAVLS